MAQSEGLQHYIPLTRAEVRDQLLADPRVPSELLEGLKQVCTMLEAIWHYRMHADLERIKASYAPVDPDLGEDVDLAGVDGFITAFDEVLAAGNWELITEHELQEALDGEDVFPISLNVRFEELALQKLYKLGETRLNRTRKSFFGLRSSELEVDAYDRIIQVIQFRDKDWFDAGNRKRRRHWPGPYSGGVHVRLFKSVPRLDLEVIFPNTSPRMRHIDRIKVGAPLIGGLVAIGIKFGPLLLGGSSGGTSNAVIGGIVSAVGTYALKSYLSYRKTKEKYLQQVSKDLYFKGLANDEAVLSAVIDLAEEQEVKEALLAYAMLVLEPAGRYTSSSLDDHIESWLLERGVRVDFEVDDALVKLAGLGLLQGEPGSGDPLSVVPIEEALRLMDDYWDNIFPYAG